LNFNLLFFFIFLCACGVKGNPGSPDNQDVPSVLDNYPGIEVDQPLNDSSTRKRKTR
jgi:hypothetical protein